MGGSAVVTRISLKLEVFGSEHLAIDSASDTK